MKTSWHWLPALMSLLCKYLLQISKYSNNKEYKKRSTQVVKLTIYWHTFVLFRQHRNSFVSGLMNTTFSINKRIILKKNFLYYKLQKQMPSKFFRSKEYCRNTNINASKQWFARGQDYFYYFWGFFCFHFPISFLMNYVLKKYFSEVFQFSWIILISIGKFENINFPIAQELTRKQVDMCCLLELIINNIFM